MKLLLDMNLSPRVVHELRSQQHEAIHWIDVGDPRADDREIMAWAAEHGYTVLTHDLDFGALLASSTHSKPSVIQIRARDVLSPQFLTTLLEALTRFKEEIDKGALVVVEPQRARVRILPLD
jgi:predicted nuclease of predicted toxin-antitoxin system